MAGGAFPKMSSKSSVLGDISVLPLDAGTGVVSLVFNSCATASPDGAAGAGASSVLLAKMSSNSSRLVIVAEDDATAGAVSTASAPLGSLGPKMSCRLSTREAISAGS